MERIAWHPAFVEAIQIELENYRDGLQFEAEHQLTAEPLKIDVMIIKKRPDLVIDKNIGRIFRANNVVEYKSPEDYVSIHDYDKVHAYSRFYAYLHQVRVDEMSVTIAATNYPKKLMEYLAGRFEVTKNQKGFYIVAGDTSATQIIVTSELDEDKNLWLKNLNKELTVPELENIFNEKQRRGKHAPLGAYFDVVVDANLETFNKLRKMGERFRKYAVETGLAAEWEALGEARGEARGKAGGVITVLRAKFGTVPEEICDSIKSYTDVTALDSLLQSAAVCTNIKDFRQNLVR
jgi:hypothetical protein